MVAQVPYDFTGWVRPPTVLLRPMAWELCQPGRRRRFPRLTVTPAPPSEVRHLITNSPVFRNRKWQRFHLKDSRKGQTADGRVKPELLAGGVETVTVAYENDTN